MIKLKNEKARKEELLKSIKKKIIFVESIREKFTHKLITISEPMHQ